MTDRFPDLELYILNADPEAVLSWLQQDIGALEAIKTTEHLIQWRCQNSDGESMDIHLTFKAEKNFASLWFKQNDTTWHTDLELARAAHSALETEIRCSDEGWKEGNENAASDNGWSKLNKGQEKSIEWH